MGVGLPLLVGDTNLDSMLSVRLSIKQSYHSSTVKAWCSTCNGGYLTNVKSPLKTPHP